MNLVPITVEMTVAESQQQFNLTVSENVMNYNMTVSEKFIAGVTPPYEGEYEFTPTSEVQTVLCNGMKMSDDIKINPIPQNYGLITYNGSYITVS